MSRRGKTKKIKLVPDPIYGNLLVARLINRVMKDGKKTIAQAQVYKALEAVKEKTSQDPLVVYSKAVENIMPSVEVKARRVGGAAYQVPQPVRGERRETLAIRWLIMAARAKANKEYHYFWEKLSVEIIDAFNNQGGAVKKKDDMHHVADANKAFAHFRW